MGGSQVIILMIININIIVFFKVIRRGEGRRKMILKNLMNRKNR